MPVLELEGGFIVIVRNSGCISQATAMSRKATPCLYQVFGLCLLDSERQHRTRQGSSAAGREIGLLFSLGTPMHAENALHVCQVTCPALEAESYGSMCKALGPEATSAHRSELQSESHVGMEDCRRASSEQERLQEKRPAKFKENRQRRGGSVVQRTRKSSWENSDRDPAPPLKKNRSTPGKHISENISSH